MRGVKNMGIGTILILVGTILDELENDSHDP